METIGTTGRQVVWVEWHFRADRLIQRALPLGPNLHALLRAAAPARSGRMAHTTTIGDL